MDSTPLPASDSGAEEAEEPMSASSNFSETPYWRGQEEIHFTGLSVRLPESMSFDEWSEQLLAGKDLLTEDDRRYVVGIYDLPRRTGKIPVINKFDSTFFGCPPVQANKMDPQIRLLLECAFEAIMDAGWNPQELRGSKTGVFVGTSASETQSFLTSDPEDVSGYALTGTTRSMFANRLSYALDLRGPSFAVDTACSSSLLAFQLAVDAIRTEQCDAALVCGSHLNLTAVSSLQFLRLGMLSPEGRSASFDEAADGYARAEGVGAVLLQRASSARRSYAQVVHAKSGTDGFKQEGITFPSGGQQAQLLEECYREAGLSPTNVSYVEAHGTGTKVGDPQEANAIAEVFCRDREGPLLIGSVKSMMGHAEPSSGIASLAKVATAIQAGLIPPNLNFTTPSTYIPALSDGRLKVVLEPTPWHGGYVAVNSFGFGGSNTHVCLKSNTDEPRSYPRTAYPKLVCVAGRTQEAVDSFLSAAEKHADNADFHALLAGIATVSPNLFPFRGYTLLHRGPGKPEPQREILKVGSQNDLRPVWFIYSGMGSQWAGMAKDMMAIDTFKDTILQCSKALQPFGVDPYEKLMLGAEDSFKDTLSSMVCITAVQLALTNLLKRVGVFPDGIIGHSTGEISAGYGDGVITLEEAILLAYHRGKSVVSTEFPPGAMAAVGLSWEEAKRRCPPGVIAACHNGTESVTISGRADAVQKLQDELEAEGVFFKLVQSQGIAFHSPDMSRVKEKMTAAFLTVLPEPRKRSSRWVSSSVPEHLWSQDSGIHVSAEYHVNNALKPVLFAEALAKIPENAVTVELAPHALMQSVLRRTLAKECTNIGLMKIKHENNVEHCLAALGKIHSAGVKVDWSALYPKVTFPVPRGTPSVSSLNRWDHREDFWTVDGKQISVGGGGAMICAAAYRADPHAPDSKDVYLLDHVIDGRALYPFTGYLFMAWKTLAKLRGLNYEKVPVIFEEVCVYRPTILSKQVKFDVALQPTSGTFEVMEDGALCASGTIRLVEEEQPFFYEDLLKRPCPPTPERVELSTADVYKEFLLRGYEYGPQFRGIYKTCNSGDRGSLFWTGNWVTFLDAFLQTALLSEKGDSLRLPTRLRYMRIDPQRHLDAVTEEDDLQVVHLRNDLATRGCIAGGVEVCDLSSQAVQRRIHAGARLILEKIYFVKHNDAEALSRWPELRQRLSTYRSACVSQLQALLKAWGTAGLASFANAAELTAAAKALSSETAKPCPAALREQWASSKDPSSSLYRLLLRLGEETADGALGDRVGELLEEWAPQTDADQLVKGALCQETLKPVLDMVYENTAGHTFAIGQADGETLVAVQTAKAMQETHPLLEVAFTAYSPTNTFTEEELGSSFTYTRFDVEKGEALPDSAKRLDGLILNRVVSRKADVDRYLTNAKRLIRDDGFVIVIEPTGDLALAGLLEGLRSQRIEGAGDSGRHSGLFLDKDEWLRRFVDAGYQVSAQQSDPALNSTLYLLRKVPSVPRRPHVVPCDDVNDFAWLEPLKKVWEDHLTAGEEETIWITSTKTPDNGMMGLTLCLREESMKHNRFRSVVDVSRQPQLDMASKEVAQVMYEDLHANIYKEGDWGSYRHLVMGEEELHEFTQTEHAFVNTTVRGDLSSLTWVESPNRFWEVNPLRKPSQELLSVYYAALNFKDVMLATGRLAAEAIPGLQDRECVLGLEFSGRTERGERRMGILPAQAMATTVVCDPDFSWPVPDSWTMEEAATVPVVYATAYYALIIRGRLRKGGSVLVHSGSGGVGQAAIAIALSMDCQVFTTVGTPEKRAFLLQRFPELRDDHISDSRSTSFEWDVRSRTGGRGVDLVLNSLAEDKLQASLRCLATHGAFCEIGKFDLHKNSNLGMALFLKNTTFHGILLDTLIQEGAENPDWVTVGHMLSRGIEEGVVRPLPTHVFPSDEPEKAFRFMAKGKHMGKVLLEVRPDDKGGLGTLPKPLKVRAVRRSYCHPQHVYLITGGLGGFGLELAQWLINRGARRLVLTSRSGVRNGYQARCLYFWRRTGIKVQISTFDVADAAQTAKLVQECQEMGPLGGVFHLAMVLRDCLFENQNVKNFQEAAAAKYWGTRHLDAVTRQLCDDQLKWFVCFSSITSGRGNAGQTNYGWANSTMERMVEQRREDGLAGLAIQWGAIGDVGVILENMGDNQTVVGGTLPQRMPSCLQALDTFLCWDHPLVSSFIRAEMGESRSSGSGDMVQAIAHILGVNDVSQLDPNTTLGDLGLDSLMGVEIKQALERDYNLVMSMKDIRNLTINKLKTLSSSGGDADGSAKPLTDTLTSLAGNMEALEAEMTSIFKLRISLEDIKQTAALVPINSVGLDSGKQPVFFAPSIEGVGKPLMALTSMVEYPAFCFQYVPGIPSTDIPSVAKAYMAEMKKVQPEGPYNIVGYSYGACVGFDLACQLQAQGEQVSSLVLLDGSHKYMQTYRNTYRKNFKVDSANLGEEPLFQVEILCALIQRFSKADYREARRTLLKEADWEARKAKATELLTSTGLFQDSETMMRSCQSIYDEFIMADKYFPSCLFDGDITLVRAEQGAAKEEDVGRDYGVGEVASAYVHVHVVPGDHDSFVNGASSPITASVINDALAPAHQPPSIKPARTAQE